MRELNLERLNDEVFVARDRIVRFGADEIDFLKKQAKASLRKRARICAHRSDTDPLHEMLIAVSAESYIRPHKHDVKSESFHIVEGVVDVVIFDDDGGIADLIELGEPKPGGRFFYRLAEPAFHTLLIKTEFLVVHEVTNGPFAPEHTRTAEWAPGEDTPAEAAKYMSRVASLAAAFKAS